MRKTAENQLKMGLFGHYLQIQQDGRFWLFIA
jgi:hypothetical protein